MSLSEIQSARPPLIPPDINATNIVASKTSSFAVSASVPTLPILPTDAVNKQYVDLHTTPGGPGLPNSAVQWNLDGFFFGNDNFTYDPLTNTMSVVSSLSNPIDGVIVADNMTVYNTPVNPTDVTNKAYVDSQSTSPGGSNTQVQFNDGGIFGGIPGVTWDGLTLNANSITTPQMPTNPNDVTNKSYVDAQIGSSPGLPLNSVQFNLGSLFTGSSNFTWDNTLNQLNVNGAIIATNVMQVSDQTRKKNIEPLDGEECLNKLNKVKCYSYNVIGQEKETLGVMAQQLQNIGLEDMVIEGPDYKSVAYLELLTMAIASINHLSEEYKSLKEKYDKITSTNTDDRIVPYYGNYLESTEYLERL